MRFDDSLKTVLAADSSTVFGAQAAFRQIADLMARGRIEPDEATLDRLRALRRVVPLDVRAATARGLALARPSAALVAVFAEDDQPVSAAVLRAARLSAMDWIALLPRLGPAGRSVLRGRADLGGAVERALATFGSVDFALGFEEASEQVMPTAQVEPADQPPAPPSLAGPFVPFGAAVDASPIAREAKQRTEVPPTANADPSRFEIADLVDRIAAFQRDRGAVRADDAPEPPVTTFRFETDAAGMIRWIDAHPRGAVVGISLARADGAMLPHVDGVATGAFRRRSAFADARLQVHGRSPLAGDWRISAVPLFDPASGRFVGYRGGARRPRADEDAARTPGQGNVEGLRRLVHELRTPTNAIAGFSELIETQLLGPVAPAYRGRAAAIRGHAADLIAAIDDLDLAARIEGGALDLRPAETPLAPMLARIAQELAPLASLRGCVLDIAPIAPALTLGCDDRAAERLFARLLAALVSAGMPDERISVEAQGLPASVVIAITRPRALAAVPEAALFSLDAEREGELPGAPLLGAGFALRLARNLAGELGGSIAIGADRLTVQLPAGSIGEMGQASTS